MPGAAPADRDALSVRTVLSAIAIPLVPYTTDTNFAFYCSRRGASRYSPGTFSSRGNGCASILASYCCEGGRVRIRIAIRSHGSGAPVPIAAWLFHWIEGRWRRALLGRRHPAHRGRTVLPWRQNHRFRARGFRPVRNRVPGWSALIL